MRRYTTVLAIAAALGAGALLSGCGGVPSDAVATVADEPLSTESFNNWMKVAARQQGGVPAGKMIAPLVPPDFTACIAAKRTEAASSKKKATTSDAQFKSQCQSEFDQGKQPVMQLLITSAWIEGQASLMGIKATDGEISKKFEETKKQAFPTEKGYQDFLKSSGQTEASLRDRIRTEVLSNKIRDAVIKNSQNVSDDEAREYYTKNGEQFGTPEKRTFNMILVDSKDKAKAEQAKSALEGGASWKDIARQYSTDSATKNSAGLVKDSIKGQQDPALDKAVFAAKQGVVIGPIKGSFGWYVIKVDKVTKGSTPEFDKVKPQIVQQVKAQKQQTALTDFVKSFQEKWKKRTNCAKYYVIDLCRNAPKQPTQPGPGTVQQAPPAGG